MTLSQKMRLALPVGIPVCCFFDEAVHDKNWKGDIRGFPDWVSEHCQKRAHHTKWPCLLQPFSSFLHFCPYWHQVSYFHACRGRRCQFQLVPVRSPRLLKKNFLKGGSLIFLLAVFESGILGSRPCCSWMHVRLCKSVLMPNWPTCRARCPAKDQRHYHHPKCDVYSLNFAWSTCAHATEAEHWQEESCKLREQWYSCRFEYETQCCLGHLGQCVASEKECPWDVALRDSMLPFFVWSCCPNCCSCWNIVVQGDVTRKVVYSEEAQFTWRIFYSSFRKASLVPGTYTNWLALEEHCQCRIALDSPLLGSLQVMMKLCLIFEPWWCKLVALLLCFSQAWFITCQSPRCHAWLTQLIAFVPWKCFLRHEQLLPFLWRLNMIYTLHNV